MKGDPVSHPEIEMTAAHARARGSVLSRCENARGGQGTMHFANGESYEGDWEADDMHGEGVYRCSRGSQYHGQWARNQKHGRGQYCLANGAIYEGDWCVFWGSVAF